MQLLRCEWDEIIPHKSAQPQLESDRDFPLESGRLADILPDSLVILQVRRPRDKRYAEEQLIEYLESKPPSLRRIDWNSPSEALKEAARIADVELHPVHGYKGWSCVIGCDCCCDLV